MERIKIKYHTDGIRVEKLEKGDWIDLRASEDVVLKEGDEKLISLGVSMKLPKGYEAHVVPRSSTFKTWGIIQTNGVGIIDNSYCGNDDIWKFPVLCLKARGYIDDNGEFVEDATFIRKGSRICQFRIVKKQPKITLEDVVSLSDVNRGGLGSTGVM